MAIEVGGEGLEINDLAAWAFEAKNEWAEQVLAQVLWQVQEEHPEAVLAGERELACPGCGAIPLRLAMPTPSRLRTSTSISPPRTGTSDG